MTFGKLLSEYRERENLSQSKLAERAGYDHSYVSRLESGVRKPTRECVVRLCETLMLSPLDSQRLLLVAGFMPTNGIITEAPGTGQILELTSRIERMLTNERYSPGHRSRMFDALVLVTNGMDFAQ